MRHYFFGYLFARIAKVIAALVLLGGLAAAAILYVRGTLEASNIRYEPASALGAKLFSVEKDWENTRDLMVEFLGPPAGQVIAPHFSKAPNTPAQFDAMAAELTRIQGQRDAWKGELVARFENLVMEIERKLRAHAAQIMAADPPPAPNTATKEEPEKPAETTSAPHKALFAEMDRAELDARRDVLKECSDLLSVLRTAVEKPENDKILGQALGQLGLFWDLLPSKLSGAMPASSPSAAKPETNDASAPREKANAEVVAEKLQQARFAVKSAVQTSWSLDRSLEQATTDVESERLRCAKAERQLKSLWLTLASTIALTVVGTLLTTFLILVSADLTQAFLDTAVNTARAAAFFETSASEE